MICLFAHVKRQRQGNFPIFEMKAADHYLQRYPFILNGKHSRFCEIIKSSYNCGVTTVKNCEAKYHQVQECNDRNVIRDSYNKNGETFCKRPLLLTDLNCAPRRQRHSPVIRSSLFYAKGSKSKSSATAGPTRYKIDKQFQSRFCM